MRPTRAMPGSRACRRRPSTASPRSPDDTFPADWEAQVAAWPRPATDDIFELVFTSGTTGNPKGVMLSHANVLATISAIYKVIPPLEHRIVSLLPLSHLLEQVVGLFYAIDVLADILYVRSRNPRVIFEAIRDHRTTSMIVVPQVLDLFWTRSSARSRSRAGRATFDRLRAHRPPPAVSLRAGVLFRRSTPGSAAACACSSRPGRSCRRPSSRPGRTWASSSSRATARPSAASASCTTPRGSRARDGGPAVPPVELRARRRRRDPVRGPTLFKGYWHDPEATAAALTADGWYRTGDIGRFDAAGRLILMGRNKDIIVLPNGFNVYPEDIENALRVAGVRDSVVVETKPGRIEAIVLAPGPGGLPQGGDSHRRGPAEDPAAVRERIDASVKAANRRSAVHQRVAAWRLWPDADFPRTHTLKVKRDQVRPGRRSTSRCRCARAPEARAGAPSCGIGTSRPTVARRVAIARGARVGRIGGRPAVDDDRRVDLPEQRLGVGRELDAAGAAADVRRLLVRRASRPSPRRGTRR